MGDTLQIHYTVRTGLHCELPLNLVRQSSPLCVHLFLQIVSSWRGAQLSMWHRVQEPCGLSDTESEQQTADRNRFMIARGAGCGLVSVSGVYWVLSRVRGDRL